MMIRLKPAQKENALEKTVESQQVYDGKLLHIYRDVVEIENGHHTIREVAKHPGGVCVAAVDEQENVWFVRQFRYAVGEDVLELPAGKLELGENPDEAVRRELSEETGCEARVWEKVGVCYPSPGYTSEVLHLYIASDLTNGSQHLDPDEDLKAFQLPLSQALQELKGGKIVDAKTQILLLTLQCRRGGRQK